MPRFHIYENHVVTILKGRILLGNMHNLLFLNGASTAFCTSMVLALHNTAPTIAAKTGGRRD
jgi:hypothetical protein